MTSSIMVVMGTRPEAIKLFPVVRLMKNRSEIVTTVCVTAQHRGMLDQVLAFSGINPEYDLDLMQTGQAIDELSAKVLLAVGGVLDRVKPDRIVVQGDTTSAMMAALAAFYRRVPVSHVEAGLRSGHFYSPWPEEANRKIVAQLADQHFAPTQLAADALLREGISKHRILVTGNTVVDALLIACQKISSDPEWVRRKQEMKSRFGDRRPILVTCHRRENFGRGVKDVAAALLEIAKRDDVYIFVPVHPNPNVNDIFKVLLADHPHICLVPPLDYLNFVCMLDLAYLILTDSGGVQEEAPTLGKPILVLRDTTERPEGVLAKTARLIGTDRHAIVAETNRLLDNEAAYQAMATAHNPFGDGLASERIVGALING